MVVSMGKLLHKSAESMGSMFICTNVYISNSRQEISVTQEIYDNDTLAHKNNVTLFVTELQEILNKAYKESL